MKTVNEFRKNLDSALTKAATDLLQKIGNEQIYAISLYTSGEGDFAYLCASANTEEGLRDKARMYAEKYPEYAGEAGIKKLRWSVPDWKYHDFSSDISSLELPDGEGKQRDSAVYKDFIYCLRELRKRKPFEKVNPQAMFLVTCGDMSEGFLLKGIKQLNPPDMVDQYIHEFTAVPYLNNLRAMPATTRVDTLIGLYRDLSLDIPSNIALDAATRNVDKYELEPLIVELGANSIPRLLDIVERYGFGKIFNDEGTAAYDKYGVCTPEDTLSTSAVFLIEKCEDIDESHIRRMQQLLSKRVQQDRTLSITSTLGENIARVLHNLLPKRFPKTELNPKTNHLDNPDPFLSTQAEA